MRVTVERSLGVTVLSLVTGEVPDDQGLVAGGGEEHVGASCLLVFLHVSIEVLKQFQRTSPWR